MTTLVISQSEDGIMYGLFPAGDKPVTYLTVKVDTDTDSGTIYWVVTDSATTPSSAQIKASQNHLGASADDSGSLVIITAGQKEDTVLFLATGTYYPHFVHENYGTDSNVLTGLSGVVA